ncbi:MAG: permease [Clostridium sp.]|nr:permease [Clostridium sp.]
MKIKVDIILGFLGSGKTSLINSFLSCKQLQDERVVVIQYEKGHTSVLDMNNVQIIKRNMDEKLDREYFKDILSKYLPDRIIIEYNGMADVKVLMEELNTSYFNKIFCINRVIDIIDANRSEIYLRNLSAFFLSHVIYSSDIIINNCSKDRKEEIQNIIRFIKGNNCDPSILKCKNFNAIYKTIKNRKLCLNYYNEKLSLNGYLKAFITIILIISLFIFIVYLNFTQKISDAYIIFSNFKVNFISIILEAFPFILIGSFISSAIQICVPDKWIYKIFNKNKILSSFSASLLGIAFPICDCGTIPLALGFLNKGIPLNAVIAFMLAAPIMNPISILATYYAFQNDIRIVFYRVFLGILIAVICSLILGRYKKEEVINNYIENCNCELCNGTYKDASIIKKINGIFINTADEFFKVSKFLIVGAIFTSLFQLLHSNDLLSIIPENKFCYLAFMMIIAFLLSICSTSDAFIAKGFTCIVPLNSIIGFLVAGPMIDIKNTIMFTAYFKKSFILKYILTVFITTFLILMFIPV